MQYQYFVDISSWFFIAFMLSSAVSTALGSVLDWMNSDGRLVKRGMKLLHSLGSAARRAFPFHKVRKAMDYRRTKSGFDDMVDSVESGLSTLLVIFGAVPFTVSAVHALFPGMSMVWCWIATTAVVTICSLAASLPADYYRTFHIDGRFGLNRSTRRTFFTDAVKTAVLSVTLSVPLTLALDWVLRRFGGMDASGAVGVVVGVLLAGYTMKLVFVYVFLPMFNRFEPLGDGRLARRLERLCRRCGIGRVSISVMDASRRSAQSNAFILGFLGRKRIVLFDNMLKAMTHDEIEAVVAHEIGHWRLHHLAAKCILSMVATALTVSMTFILMKCPSFYHAFGYSWVSETNLPENMVIGFWLASMFISSFTWVLSPASNWLSRRMERAADGYACSVIGDPRALSTALLKLSSDNLSDLFPHPVYEFVNYSHPSIVPRVRRILEWK